MKNGRKYSFPTLVLASVCALPVFSAEPPANSNLAVIPVGSQSSELRETLSIPTQNKTMTQVLDMLGDPNEVYVVGNPKITRWKYDDMIVYFEKDKVLRTVVHAGGQTTVVASQK